MHVPRLPARVVSESRRQLAESRRPCYERGWALGTSGNFSAVVRKEPLALGDPRHEWRGQGHVESESHR